MFLRGLDQLPAAVLQTTCDLLTEVQRARETQATSLQWRGETIRVTHDNPSACFASVLVHPGQPFPRLPSSVSQSFKTCSVPLPDLRLILEALFLVHEFESAVHLAKQLSFLCDAFTELFGQNFAAIAYQNSNTETESAKSREEHVAAYCCPPGMDLPARPPLGLRFLKGVVSLAQRHMQEFDALGLMDTGEGGGGGALHALSTVYSEISESTRASLKFRSTLTQVSSIVYHLSIYPSNVYLSIIYCLLSSIVYCLSSIYLPSIVYLFTYRLLSINLLSIVYYRLSSIVYHLFTYCQLSIYLLIVYCLSTYCLSSVVYRLLSIIYLPIVCCLSLLIVYCLSTYRQSSILFTYRLLSINQLSIVYCLCSLCMVFVQCCKHTLMCTVKVASTCCHPLTIFLPRPLVT